MVSSDTLPRLVPDKVLAQSPFLQELQRRGLYDHTGPGNAWPELPRFQLVPEPLIAELGTWAAALLRSALFHTRVKLHNEISLPQPVALGTFMDGRSINPPIAPYQDYVRAALKQLVAAAGEKSGAAPGTEAFALHFYGYLITFIRMIAPKVCSGDFPLSFSVIGRK